MNLFIGSLIILAGLFAWIRSDEQCVNPSPVQESFRSVSSLSSDIIPIIQHFSNDSAQKPAPLKVRTRAEILRLMRESGSISEEEEENLDRQLRIIRGELPKANPISKEELRLLLEVARVALEVKKTKVTFRVILSS